MKRPLSLASLALALVVLPSSSQAVFLHQGYTQVSDVDGNIGFGVVWTGYGDNNATSWRLAIVHAKADPLLPMRVTGISLIAGLQSEGLGNQTELSLVRLGAEANFVNLNDSPGYADKFMLGTMTGGTGDWGHASNAPTITLKEYTFGGLAPLGITLAPGQDEWFAITKGPASGGSATLIPSSDVTAGYRNYFGSREESPKYKPLPVSGSGEDWGINVSAAPVPEPATIGAFGIGLAALLKRRCPSASELQRPEATQ